MRIDIRIPCEHLICTECLPQISKGADETVTCPQCRRVFPREEVGLLQYTETERWDELLKLAGESTHIDYGGGETTSEQEEEDFIDDDESRWALVRNQICEAEPVLERSYRKAVSFKIKVKKTAKMKGFTMEAGLLQRHLVVLFHTQSRQLERSERRWRNWHRPGARGRGYCNSSRDINITPT